MSEPKESNSHSTRRFLIDYVMFVCALGTILTGAVMWLCVSKGRLGEKFFLGWHRHEWGDLHTFFALAFMLLVIVHLVQHWTWIKVVVRKQAGWKSGIGNTLKIAAVTILVLAAIWILFTVLRPPPGFYRSGGRFPL